MAPDAAPDDAALVDAALKGDNGAFSSLMQRHKQRLYVFIRRYVGDADEALDLVQESFFAAWSALDRFDAKRSFAIWLRRIAINKCRDWTRRRKVRNFFFAAAPLNDATSPAPEETNEPNDPELDARLADLDSAIAALPTGLKEALLLTAFDGLAQQEAGELLGVSAKAIETRIYRAKQHLRRALGANR